MREVLSDVAIRNRTVPYCGADGPQPLELLEQSLVRRVHRTLGLVIGEGQFLRPLRPLVRLGKLAAEAVKRVDVVKLHWDACCAV